MIPLLLSLALASPLELADAVAAGDCTTVLASAPDEGDWRVVRGYCSLKTGDAEAAVEALEKPIDGPVGEYGRLLLARARLQLGTEGVEDALEGLDLPGDAGVEIRRTRARLAVQRGDVAAFTAATKGLDGPEITYLTAELAFANGDVEAAWSAWRRLVQEAEPGGWDAKALDRIAQTGGTLDQADPLVRVAQLRKVGRIDEASELADTIDEVPEPARVELAKVYMQARRYEPAIAQWSTILGSPDEAEGRATHLFDYALSHARTGDYDTSAVVYRRLIAQHPGDPKAVTASYKLGYMAYDEGSCGEALQLFGEHIKAYPKSVHLDEALWFSARCRWKSSDFEHAAEDLTALQTLRPQSSLVSGAAYWQARARGKTGHSLDEAKLLNSVISRWPSSGYAWLAANRLERTFPSKPAAQAPPWPDSLKDDPAVIRAEALLAVGFRAWARTELAPVKDRISTKGERLAAAWRFIAAGDYKTGKRLASKHCVSPWKDGDPVAQQACTPRPEVGIVHAVARRYDLDPNLPFAIMTAESALDPSVTSWAGARGLMQLMPVEGPRIHGQLYPERPFDPDDLYSAPYNASMGTTELGMKRQSLDGVLDGSDLPAVIASYNGGEEAVRRWVDAYDEAPELDEFIEDIGYTETRRYVKRVLGFAMAYRWVYGDES